MYNLSLTVAKCTRHLNSINLTRNCEKSQILLVQTISRSVVDKFTADWSYNLKPILTKF